METISGVSHGLSTKGALRLLQLGCAFILKQNKMLCFLQKKIILKGLVFEKRNCDVF